MIVSLDLAREHLCVESDGHDTNLKAYLGAAILFACEFMNRQVFADQDALDTAVAAGVAGDCPMVVNDMIRSAVLLILGRLYANRGDVEVGAVADSVPQGALTFLQPYRIHMGV